MSDLTGKKIGRYQIVERLGQGGMATVYKAYDTRLEREVAIKTIRTDMFPPAVLPDVLARFEREAKALARLDHPNILRVHDYGEYENAPYLVMAFVQGGSLRDRTGQIYTPVEAVSLLAPVARALEYAHTMGILHRDIKPANILISSRGIPLLSDFGIAKILDADSSDGLTATGMAIGTPEYMAPEQSSGEKVDARADIYALGVVLFELLSGRRPFEGNTPIDVMIKTRTAPLPSLNSLGLKVSPEVEAVVQRALARETAERYATMGAFAEDLEEIAATARSTIDTASSRAVGAAPALATPFPTDPSVPPLADSGGTITHPTPAPIHPETIDSGRTVTTPPPPSALGSAPTAVVPGEAHTAITPSTPIPAPPPPPTQGSGAALIGDRPSPKKKPAGGLPVWAYIAIFFVLVLLIGGGIWIFNQPNTPGAAVVPTSTLAPIQPEEVNILIWDVWSDEMELEQTHMLLMDYQSTVPGLTIELVNPGEQNILEAIRSGNGPDILIGSNEYLGKIVEGLVPLNEMGVKIENLRSRFAPVAVAGVVWQDQVWGVPLAQKAIAVVYNKELVTALDFPSDSNDMDGLVKKAIDFQKRTGKFLVCNPGFSGGDAYFAAPLFFAMGMPGYLNENGDVFVSTPAGREAGRVLKAWQLTASPRDTNYDLCKAMFQNGEAGGWWIGPWEKWLFTNPEMNLAVARMGKPFVTLRAASLTQNAVNRKHGFQAMDIINFLSQPENQIHMALTAFSIPVSDAAMGNPELRGNPLISGFFYTGIQGIPISPSPFTDLQWEPMEEAIRKIWNGDQLPAEALTTAQKQIEEAIQKAR